VPAGPPDSDGDQKDPDVGGCQRRHKESCEARASPAAVAAASAIGSCAMFVATEFRIKATEVVGIAAAAALTMIGRALTRIGGELDGPNSQCDHKRMAAGQMSLIIPCRYP
jgi:hypothetical protein